MQYHSSDDIKTTSNIISLYLLLTGTYMISVTITHLLLMIKFQQNILSPTCQVINVPATENAHAEGICRVVIRKEMSDVETILLPSLSR